MRKKRENYTAQDREDLELCSMRVYDLIDLNNLDMTFANRYRLLTQLLTQVDAARRPNLRFVENFPINTFEQVNELHERFVDEGYEGLMVRNLDSVYKLAGRSSDLMKVKSFKTQNLPLLGMMKPWDRMLAHPSGSAKFLQADLVSMLAPWEL